MQDDEAVDAMLACTSFPSVLRAAGEKAFLDYSDAINCCPISIDSIENVRDALKSLRSPGWFEFEDEDTV